MARPVEALKSILVGRPKATAGLEHERLTKRIALAVFASDALSSSAYATEEMLLVLVTATAGAAALSFSIPIAIGITTVLGIVIFSYRQTIHAYPNGASAYIVATDNLGKYPGLVAGAALLIDYVLTVAVSVTAGVAALVALAPGLHPFRVLLAIGVIIVISLLNLRGIKEAGAIFAVPTYAYILLISSLLIYGFIKYAGGVDLDPIGGAHEMAAHTEPLLILVILKAFAQGSTALTGVEAISDGVQAFKKPVEKNASHTLVVMGVMLGILFIGVTVLARLYEVNGPTEDPHRTVVALIALRVFGEGPLFIATQIATFLILFLAANTSYSDFPRLANFLARDRNFPRQFMNRGDRLAFSNGIIALGAFAALLIAIYQAELNQIINLYVLGVFLSFTLSQTGMVQRWRRLRDSEPGWRRSAFINGLGATTTFVVLLVVLYSKFLKGAYIVVAAIPILVWIMNRINKHYQAVATQLRDPSRRPIIGEQQNHVILLVGSPSEEEARAFWYADRIRTDDFHAVHFKEKGDPKGGFEAQWARRIGILPTSPLLESVESGGAIVDDVRKYVERMRGRIEQEDFVSVIISERIKQGPLITLGTRTGFRLKLGLLFIKDIVVTDVPYFQDKPMPALGPAVDTRHVVVVLVSAAHNATLHALEYAKTLSADDVHAVHVALDPEASEKHQLDWHSMYPTIPLEIIDSPHRRLAGPILDYVRSMTADGRTIVTLILPEFVVSKWWHRFLHNQNAFDVKWTFLPEPDVIVTSVPYHLD